MTAWTDHVKKWAKENNKTYGCAISDPRCKASYKAGDVASAREKVVESVQKIKRFPSEFEPFRFEEASDIDKFVSQLPLIEKYEKDPNNSFRYGVTARRQFPEGLESALGYLRTLRARHPELANKSSKEIVALARRYADYRFRDERTNFRLKEVPPSSQNVYARELRQAEEDAKSRAEAQAPRRARGRPRARQSSSNAPNPSDTFNFV